jgi:L-alanine-DL-glutamate epimerase-like enolase superfamily enzyme
MGGFHAELLVEPLQFESGRIVPPTGPGLGVQLNEAVALANPYTGSELHLEMRERPITGS